MDILGFYVSDWLLLFAGLLIALYWFFTRKFDVLKQIGVPYKKPKLFFGNLLELSEDVVSFEGDYSEKFGKLFGFFEGRNPVICSMDPNVLKTVLIKEFHNFTDRRPMYFRGYLKDGVFDAEGAHWRGMRNLLTPAFSSGKLKNMMQPMQQSVDHLVEQMESIIKTKGGRFETKQSSMLFTMDVIGAAVFGINLDCRNDPENMFAVMARRYFDLSTTTFAIILAMYLNFLCPLLEKVFNINMFDKSAEAYLAHMVKEAIKAKKESGKKSKDFLGIIINAGQLQDMIDEEDKAAMNSSPSSKLSKLTDDEVVGNALLFFAAGFETTATTLGFLLYHLAVNQDIQEKLREEAVEILGNEPSTLEQLGKLPLMEQCIFETLRVCPPVLRVERKAKKEVRIGDLVIPKGVLVNIPIYGMHRNPKVWPEPDKWRPERFSPEEKAGRDPMHFLPFGQGPRQCIGMRLALQEIKMAAADLVRKFRFTATDETPIPLTLNKTAILCTSESPLIVKVERL